ncbi:galacturonic acid acetylase [Paenibacillus rigui]|uniref:Galacturonic acid acetylase n=2 Tax=Paenibacillus rigui TaxID=554312 RepID=A0A229UPR8_9BACL|nr:galacturonic acid acetylase [Paenibacillus rigui]
MYAGHIVGLLRGLFFRAVYYKNIKASLFFLQANSRIEVFSKASRVTIGRFVYIRKNASLRVDLGGELHLGDKVFINDNCNINCVGRVSIGAHTKIAPNVCINDHDHNYKSSSNDHLLIGEVTIGSNVWIGSNVVILRDTTIGDNAVIAAGSIVKGNVPSDTVFMNKRERHYIPYAAASGAP